MAQQQCLSTLLWRQTPADPLFSMDTVTIPTLQHERDMPLIVMTSTVALFQDWHRSVSMIVCEQLVSISAKHYVLLS